MRQKNTEGDLEIEGKRLGLPISGVYNNSYPSLFFIGSCPFDDFPVTIMSALLLGGLAHLLSVIVLVRKYGPQQKENLGGISLCCINIHYPPIPVTVITLVLKEGRRWRVELKF